jgi:7-carboxy-7-deazaguanine synthase
MTDTLLINEVYLSIQGESTLAGLPCVFVRLTACNLRCSYCDTAYAFTEGKRLSLGQILTEVNQLATPYLGKSATANLGKALPSGAPGRLPLVELTGGEPLLQAGSLELMQSLCSEGFTVLLETSGALDIGPVDPRVRRIMDLKCPSSGESARNRWENLQHLKGSDEVKFVIATWEDYHWAKDQISLHGLDQVCPLLFSWASPLLPHQQDPSLNLVEQGQKAISRRELVQSLIADALPVRFQLQIHKFVWPPDQRGV